MPQTRPQGVRGARILRSGKTIRPLVPRSNSHKITSPLLLSTSKRLSKRGRHEPSQLLADAFEEIMAESQTALSSQTSSFTSDNSAADSSIVATVHNVADPDTRARSPGDLPSFDSEAVGLPFDGLWDHDAAYDRRYCYSHGEYEYLLDTKDRWMRPKDFVPANAVTGLKAKELDAEIKLENLHSMALVDLQDRMLALDPHARKCQAECGGALSHVHAVIQKKEQAGVALYRIKWKTCWTPESKLSDEAWLLGSLQANKDPRRRRSLRQRDNLKEQEYHQNVMRVKKLRKVY
ncbi:uncharacterized protein PV06_11614 [Exophiala oligosperma]|uniref:Chromo domain-containing protein n=1 Tax=Exophiala oligosperma TaxID=215243 RepID=A0A0D2BF29_9EURO|nr:uncharacterized protein PV06_11614 [Exophiala oligosperma]KIW36102.1 hypothetical protein PV06_11614 [Exophiala oligosperma]